MNLFLFNGKEKNIYFPEDTKGCSIISHWPKESSTLAAEIAGKTSCWETGKDEGLGMTILGSSGAYHVLTMLAESLWQSPYMLVMFYCEGLKAFSFLHVGIPLGAGKLHLWEQIRRGGDTEMNTSPLP